jgi:hypothetical protein
MAADCTALSRRKYRFQGNETRLTVGVYPAVPAPMLAAPSAARRDALKGMDPGVEKKAHTERQKVGADTTFGEVARHWYARTASTLAESTRTKRIGRLEAEGFPWIGDRPASELAASDLLAVIRRMDSGGAVHPAKRDPSRDLELMDILPP